RRVIMSARPAPAARPPAATYTAAELAALLKCSLKHVQRLTTAGTVPGVIRFGRLVRYSREAVDRWLAAGEPDDARRPDRPGRRRPDAQLEGAGPVARPVPLLPVPRPGRPADRVRAGEAEHPAGRPEGQADQVRVAEGGAEPAVHPARHPDRTGDRSGAAD